MRASRLILLVPIAHSIAVPLPDRSTDPTGQAGASLQPRHLEHTSKLEPRGFDPLGFVQNQWNRFQTWRKDNARQAQTSPQVPSRQPATKGKKPGAMGRAQQFVTNVGNNIKNFRSKTTPVTGNTVVHPELQEQQPRTKGKRPADVKLPDRFREGLEMMSDDRVYETLPEERKKQFDDCMDRQISKFPILMVGDDVMWEVLRGNQRPPAQSAEEKAAAKKQMQEEGQKHYAGAKKLCMGIQRDWILAERKKREKQLQEGLENPEGVPQTVPPAVEREREREMTPSAGQFASEVMGSMGGYFSGNRQTGGPVGSQGQPKPIRVPRR